MKTTKLIGSDSYFIRLTDAPNTYMHPIPEGYKLSEGIIGAAIWTQSNAKQFIRQLKKERGIINLEMVKAKPLIEAGAKKDIN